MIEVRRLDDERPCRSQRERGCQPAKLQLTIGAIVTPLCVECARCLFNATGFMLHTVTGESIAQLVGLKPTKAKGKRS